jgi:cobalt-zinc-cadmium efflux system protein
MVLLIAMGAIAWESIGRINAPQVQEGGAMAVVAGVGIIINSFTAWLFFKDQEHDMNIKGAYLHLAADALVSLAVVMAGILIYYTGWYWLDTVMSLGIVVVIVIGTWGLLRDSLILTLDGVPRGVNMEKIEEKLRSYPGIEAVSHLHVWAISTTDNALTVHLTLGQGYDLAHFNSIKSRIKHDLEHLSIQHSTIEIELPGESSDACW